jgi:hypothetical protein
MDDSGRREAALALMLGRFPSVADRVGRVYRLRLPRHVAVFCALWVSANDAEREALDYLMVRPFGLTEYFGDDGLRLAGRDGMDERLTWPVPARSGRVRDCPVRGHRRAALRAVVRQPSRTAVAYRAQLRPRFCRNVDESLNDPVAGTPLPLRQCHGGHRR